MSNPIATAASPAVLYRTGAGSWGDTAISKKPMAIKNTVQLFIRVSALPSEWKRRAASQLCQDIPVNWSGSSFLQLFGFHLICHQYKWGPDDKGQEQVQQ